MKIKTIWNKQLYTGLQAVVHEKPNKYSNTSTVSQQGIYFKEGINYKVSDFCKCQILIFNSHCRVPYPLQIFIFFAEERVSPQTPVYPLKLQMIWKYKFLRKTVDLLYVQYRESTKYFRSDHLISLVQILNFNFKISTYLQPVLDLGVTTWGTKSPFFFKNILTQVPLLIWYP